MAGWHTRRPSLEGTLPLSPVEQYSKFPCQRISFCDNRSSPVWIPESSFHEELEGIHNVPAHSISPQPTSSISLSTHPDTLITQVCIVCENPGSSAHMCPGCKKPIHAICGPSAEDNEGYGCPV